MLHPLIETQQYQRKRCDLSKDIRFVFVEVHLLTHSLTHSRAYRLTYLLIKGDLFGTLEPIEFERPFDLRLVGDRAKLPRGKVTAGDKQDPAAMRSIHLGGEGQAKIIEDALEKEKEDWKKKVVVDSLSIKIGGFKERDKVLQFQRTKDILDGEPNRLALKHLRTKKSVTGTHSLTYSLTHSLTHSLR